MEDISLSRKAVVENNCKKEKKIASGKVPQMRSFLIAEKQIIYFFLQRIQWLMLWGFSKNVRFGMLLFLRNLTDCMQYFFRCLGAPEVLPVLSVDHCCFLTYCNPPLNVCIDYYIVRWFGDENRKKQEASCHDISGILLNIIRC